MLTQMSTALNYHVRNINDMQNTIDESKQKVKEYKNEFFEAKNKNDD